jgi:chromosome segregation ATPase
MPTSKKPAKRRTAAKRPSGQLEQLRKTIKGLRSQLEREIKARKVEARVKSEAQKARAQLASQIAALREQGRKLASELKSAVGDAGKREAARKQALDKIAQLKQDSSTKVAQLRSELSQKTAELSRKSEELKKLAGETAHRAVGIIRGDAPQASPEPPPESMPSGSDVPPEEEQ